VVICRETPRDITQYSLADVLVAEQFLNGADVVVLLQQVGGKRVTEGVARGRRHLGWCGSTGLMKVLYSIGGA
jgi:hypothetical protein